MPAIRTALVTLPWSEALLSPLRDALSPAEVVCAHRHDSRAIAATLQRADVAFIAGDIDQRHLDAPHLQWVHCGHAGLERSATPALFAGDLIVTSAAGRSAPALAEHAMLFVLALNGRLHRFIAAQRDHRWGIAGQNELRALHGKTLGIVGLGHTGTELASRARAFGMHVLAYRRRPVDADTVDHLYSRDAGDTLEPLLAASDFVVLALPLSDQTRQLIGARELATMRTGACLVNIARGGLVDENALLQALHRGRLAGAAIDVAAEEPLPAGSPLWEAPNLLITPHVTPRLPDREERALALLLENIGRYRAGEPLHNVLAPDDCLTPVAPAPASTPVRLLQRVVRSRRRLLHRIRTR